jgi:hypothetical protein
MWNGETEKSLGTSALPWRSKVIQCVRDESTGLRGMIHCAIRWEGGNLSKAPIQSLFLLIVAAILPARARAENDAAEALPTLAWTEPGGSLPAIASNGKDYLVAWAQFDQAMNFSIRASRLDTNGMELERFVVSDLVFNTMPAIAVSSNRYLIAWKSGERLFTRLAPSPGELKPIVSIPYTGAVEGRIAAAGGLTGFVVAYVQHQPALRRTIWIDGLDLEGVWYGGSLLTAQFETDWVGMAGGNAGWILAWNQYGETGNPPGLQGVAAGRQFTISHATQRDVLEKYEPAAIWNGRYFVVTWINKKPNEKARLQAAVINRRGRVLLRDIPLGHIEGAVANPALTRRGNRLLLTWTEKGEATRLYGVEFLHFGQRASKKVKLWDNLGEGYAVTASASPDSALAVLELRSQEGSSIAVLALPKLR